MSVTGAICQLVTGLSAVAHEDIATSELTRYAFGDLRQATPRLGDNFAAFLPRGRVR